MSQLTNAQIENRIWFGGTFTTVEQYSMANELVQRREQDAVAKALAAVAQAYEDWEADLLMENKCWHNATPQPTQELWDRWVDIQADRNVALQAWKEANDAE
jgi:hypothetical protein